MHQLFSTLTNSHSGLFLPTIPWYCEWCICTRRLFLHSWAERGLNHRHCSSTGTGSCSFSIFERKEDMNIILKNKVIGWNKSLLLLLLLKFWLKYVNGDTCRAHKGGWGKYSVCVKQWKSQSRMGSCCDWSKHPKWWAKIWHSPKAITQITTMTLHCNGSLQISSSKFYINTVCAKVKSNNI